jgi:GTPase SAR1 family protein
LRDSVNSIESWKAGAIEDLPNVPIILTATKCDLRDVEAQCVSTNEGQNKAHEINAPHISASARTGTGIDSLKEELVQQAVNISKATLDGTGEL